MGRSSMQGTPWHYEYHCTKEIDYSVKKCKWYYKRECLYKATLCNGSTHYCKRFTSIEPEPEKKPSSTKQEDNYEEYLLEKPKEQPHNKKNSKKKEKNITRSKGDEKTKLSKNEQWVNQFNEEIRGGKRKPPEFTYGRKSKKKKNKVIKEPNYKRPEGYER